jgi:hypothetical protein
MALSLGVPVGTADSQTRPAVSSPTTTTAASAPKVSISQDRQEAFGSRVTAIDLTTRFSVCDPTTL